MAVTAAGRRLARLLPYPLDEGPAGPAVRRLWGEVEGLVVFLPTGATVRIVAPLLSSKHSDPAVVCVDEAGRHAVALCGGHAGGANDLAAEVAAVLGAAPVITTGTDAAGLPALDALPGFRAEGDVAGVTVALLDGRPPRLETTLEGWPPPAALSPGGGPERAMVTDRLVDPEPGLVLLRPPCLVVGVGCSSGASGGEATALVAAVLAEAGLSPLAVGAVATIDRRATHPAVAALGWPVTAYPAEALAGVEVPNPNPAVTAAVGTPSVAEAAALLAAGAGSVLAATKRSGAAVTVAVARRRGPAGRVTVVGLGPGHARYRTPAAAGAVRGAEVVIGYRAYVDMAADLLSASQTVLASPIGEEVGRAKQAADHAAGGRRVAVVCSGDPGVYAMASLVLEVAAVSAPAVEVEVVAGVSAAHSSAAVLGAPLGHDHAVISLSDLLTPWPVIERRLRSVGEADLVVALYNPRSAGRTWQLPAALAVLGQHRSPSTPVGLVTDAGRDSQRAVLTTLDQVEPSLVGMTTCVIVGSSTTRVTGGRMVTPRGYRP